MATAATALLSDPLPPQTPGDTVPSPPLVTRSPPSSSPFIFPVVTHPPQCDVELPLHILQVKAPHTQHEIDFHLQGGD